ATRQHISSGVSTTTPSFLVRYLSRKTRSAGSVQLPTFDGRASDSIGFLLFCQLSERRRGRNQYSVAPLTSYILWCAGHYHAGSSARQGKRYPRGVHRLSTRSPATG